MLWIDSIGASPEASSAEFVFSHSTSIFRRPVCSYSSCSFAENSSGLAETEACGHRLLVERGIVDVHDKDLA